jgi:hypothetical protein
MHRNFATTVLITQEEITGILNQISRENNDAFRKACSDFFTRFGIAHLIRAGQFFQAIDRGEEILHLCHRNSNDGKLRNTSGHNLGWTDKLTKEQYLQGFPLISVSCLHAISTLYRFES